MLQEQLICDLMCSVVHKCWLINGDMNVIYGMYNINMLYVVYICLMVSSRLSFTLKCKFCSYA